MVILMLMMMLMMMVINVDDDDDDDYGDDYDDDEEEEEDEDDEDERKMMLMLRRRKRRMLRRKTDPKNGKHTLREPAQAKCRRTLHKSHFVWKVAGKMPANTSGDIVCVRACAVEMHIDMSQEAFCAVIYRENAGPISRDTRFVRACAIEMHMDMSQEAFVRKFTGKMPDAADTTSIEHQALP